MSSQLDIQQFCADIGDSRGFLHSPFNHGAYTYATSGYCAIRVPVRSQYSKGTISSAKKTLEKAFDSIEERKFLTIPDFDWPEKPNCHTCEGTGKTIKSRCFECEGCGVLNFETDLNTYTIECKNCGGEGEIKPTDNKPCGPCDGEGKRYNYGAPFNFSDHRVSIDLIALNPILQLPSVQVSFCHESNQLYFRFNGGYGVLMGMRR